MLGLSLNKPSNENKFYDYNNSKWHGLDDEYQGSKWVIWERSTEKKLYFFKIVCRDGIEFG